MKLLLTLLFTASTLVSTDLQAQEFPKIFGYVEADCQGEGVDIGPEECPKHHGLMILSLKLQDQCVSLPEEIDVAQLCPAEPDEN
jgi:hypothetical protein